MNVAAHLQAGLLFGSLTLIGPLLHGAELEVLHAFEAGPTLPYSSLVRGIDGNFYGSSGYGGRLDGGTIYRVTPSNAISVVTSFSGRGGPVPGSRPGELIQDDAGILYGVTHSGSSLAQGEYGTVFKVTPQGVHTVLYDFNDPGGSAINGGNPVGPLVRDSAGNLFGATQTGGSAGKGVVFKISAAGQFTLLVNFTGTAGTAPGQNPYAGLISDGAGGLLGTTQSGGTANYGLVFRILPDGTYSVLGQFTGSGGALPGSDPRAALTPDGAGSFYGVTSGFRHAGKVFRVNANGAVTTLATIGPEVGQHPSGALVKEDSGDFLGVLGLGPGDPVSLHFHGSIFRVTPAGAVSLVADPHLSPLRASVGSRPMALTLAGNGGYVGVMQTGGSNGTGTLFRLGPAMEFSHITAFPGATLSQPQGSLVSDAAGNLYGVTRHGGVQGEGTVFKFTPGSGLTTLASFTGVGGNAKGSLPFPGLAIDPAGNLFGTTIAGGLADSGTVFKIAPDGTFTTLVEFTGGNAGQNGERPQGVVLDATGNLHGAAHRYSEALDSDEVIVYKITAAGVFSMLGSTDIPFDHFPAGRLGVDEAGNIIGSVRPDDDDPAILYRMAPNGTVTTISKPRDTSLSYGVVRGPDGSFYGHAITSSYGVSRSRIAKISAMGDYRELALLDATAQGSYPTGEVLVDETGNVFGVTSTGGPQSRGTLFRVSPRGVVTTLHAFDDLIAPLYWAYGLTRHPDGALYGVFQRGSPGGGGGIHRVRAGPTPTTQEATAVAGSSATLRAKVNPHGEPTSVVFEYGPTPALGSQVAPMMIGAGTSFVDVEAPLGGLTPGLTYFYRSKATSVSGTQYGDVLNTSAAYTPFDLWKISHFGNPAHVELSDPDGDGIPLLIEYGLNLSPTGYDPAGLPTLGSSPSLRSTLTFQRDSSRTDIDLVVEAAFNVAGPWITVASSFGGAPFPGESVVPGVHTVSVWDFFPIFSAESRFMRLRVTRN